MEIKLKKKYKSAQRGSQKGGHNDGLRPGKQKKNKIGKQAHEKKFGPQRQRVMVLMNNKVHFEDMET